ncbi:gp4.2 [Erwinia phage vB_EamP-L1]|uniref:Gp4.2 n=1 Tax=Erwinia phage vB_EamP-L1 TaxID=1051673 RepID=G0YQ60_9CAUD|nr:gp4.2 [Erwinia phage vB_EamP-L1]AEJ81487.1 gp4.2 [Erwinia phage vB_EamP-L1]
MKKVVLLALLTYVVVVHFVNCLILLSPLSVTSKVITLMLSSLGFSSVASLVILASLGIWNTTSSRAGSNRLASLRAAEERIAQSKAGMTKISKCDIKGCTCGCPVGEQQI